MVCVGRASALVEFGGNCSAALCCPLLIVVLNCCWGSVYELWRSLVTGRKYTYDMYTAVPQHTYKIRKNRAWEPVSRVVVGITDGVTAHDGIAPVQSNRQAHFPLPLLESAVKFKCLEGEASQPEDKENILSAIGEQHEELDNLVHGVVVKEGLGKALAAYGPGERLEPFLQGLAKGKVSELTLDFSSVPAEWQKEEVMRAIVEAVDPETIERLELISSEAAGDWLAPLVGRKFERLTDLTLLGCQGLESLPQGVFDGMGELWNLDLSYYEGLQSQPAGMLDKLGKLERLILRNCTSLRSLPDGLLDGHLDKLTRLTLRNCPAAESLPQSAHWRRTAAKSSSRVSTSRRTTRCSTFWQFRSPRRERMRVAVTDQNRQFQTLHLSNGSSTNATPICTCKLNLGSEQSTEI